MQMSKKTKIMIFTFMLLILIGFIIFKPKDCYSAYVYPILAKIPQVGYLTTYNFPPEDYYTPIVSLPINQGEQIVKIKFKYKGRYDLWITNIHSNSPWNSGICVRGQIVHQNGELYFDFRNEDVKLYGYEHHGINKYFCDGFLTPKDVPLNTEVLLKVRFGGNIWKLLSNNPKAEFELIKRFDK